MALFEGCGSRWLIYSEIYKFFPIMNLKLVNEAISIYALKLENLNCEHFSFKCFLDFKLKEGRAFFYVLQ